MRVPEEFPAKFLPQCRAIWDQMPLEDKQEYSRIRMSFVLNHPELTSRIDGRTASFIKAIRILIDYVNRSEKGKQDRAILVGLCVAGCAIFVNIRQVKDLIGRCKSSINGSFQQLGYLALHTKTKARLWIAGVLQRLGSDKTLLKQWSVRVASAETVTPFPSNFSLGLPGQREFSEEGQHAEKKVVQRAPRRSRTARERLAVVNQLGKVREPIIVDAVRNTMGLGDSDDGEVVVRQPRQTAPPSNILEIAADSPQLAMNIGVNRARVVSRTSVALRCMKECVAKQYADIF